jgi:DNA-binding NarL/FixJ family response regulator
MVTSAKVLSVGLGGLVSARNAALRAAGFDVVAALSFEEAFQHCCPVRFDVAIVGHAFSTVEKAQLVRCIQGIFQMPVILVTEDPYLCSMHAASYIRVDAPSEDLVCAVNQLLSDERPAAAAV